MRLRLLSSCIMGGLLSVSSLALEISDLKVTLNPNGTTPLSGLATFRTDEPAGASLVVTDGQNESRYGRMDRQSTVHVMPVLYLRPDREHTVTITVHAQGKEPVNAEPVTVKTDPLPDDFPPYEVKIRRSRRMEPGVTLIPVKRAPPGGPDLEYGLAFALDSSGDVVWYYDPGHSVSELTRISTGNLLYSSGREGRLFEIDMLGNIVQQWHTTGVPKEDIPASSVPVAIDTFHHDVIEMPSGNFLALSTEARHYEDYPLSAFNPDRRGPSNVIGDTVVEFKRDGTVVRQIGVLDILDPYRVYPGSQNTTYYAEVYKNVIDKPGRDWGHVNAIVYDERDDSVLLSSYHQGVVLKASMATGELIWMLCDSEDWSDDLLAKRLKPADKNTLLNSRQHGLKLLPDDTFLMFDNGDFRTGPVPEGAPKNGAFSRAVIFDVDQAAGTVSQVWQFGGAEDDWFYSTFACDADLMPETGNILITDGGRIKDKDGKDTASFAGRHWARILEVTRDTPAQKVFELQIEDPSVGWHVYRSERLPSLYWLDEHSDE